MVYGIYNQSRSRSACAYAQIDLDFLYSHTAFMEAFKRRLINSTHCNHIHGSRDRHLSTGEKFEKKKWKIAQQPSFSHGGCRVQWIEPFEHSFIQYIEMSGKIMLKSAVLEMSLINVNNGCQGVNLGINVRSQTSTMIQFFWFWHQISYIKLQHVFKLTFQYIIHINLQVNLTFISYVKSKFRIMIWMWG